MALHSIFSYILSSSSEINKIKQKQQQKLNNHMCTDPLCIICESAVCTYFILMRERDILLKKQTHNNHNNKKKT